MNDTGQYDKVDPAALLLAVLTVSLPSITEPGAWSPLSTVTAVVIGVIVYCFTWPHAPQRFKQVDRWVITAQSLVFGVITSVAVSWPVQSMFVSFNLHCKDNFLHCVLIATGDCEDRITSNYYELKATWIGVVVGGIVAALFWRRLGRATQALAVRPRRSRQLRLRSAQSSVPPPHPRRGGRAIRAHRPS